MSNVSVTLPNILKINLKHQDAPVEFNIEKVPLDKRSELIQWAVEFALRQSPGDADAGMTGETLAKRRQAVKDKFDRLQQGNVPAVGQGGGASLSPETKGWIDWLAPRVTLPKGKTLSKKNWEDYAKVVMQRDLLSSGQATKETVVKMVDDNFDKWVKYMEANDEALGLCIKAAKVKTGEIGEKIASGFKIG